ncbi:hypothetical protein KZ483_09980 [Paenibacillus sp. sptzw28]|uniref:hypothetical protein n=1 Tax=Paenibacillus sp. sptzw28 TaxID=715179 RepID=UPI001C6E9E4C|nr:hypothetical protein [Paenibacillus sp. sptzw28]QYR23211.1 hypothetical protein KZ483_09980 [Paenibacillus sp. sptzw28]
MKQTNRYSSRGTNRRLFEGERLLVFTGLLGLTLAAFVAIYIGFNGAVVLPEGNLVSAFSFNAAIGVFILSIAAFMPLSGLNPRRRTILRWSFIQATLYAYAVETIQHFRGINPRFTRTGSLMDNISGALFGLESLLIIVFTVLLAIPFFRRRPSDGERTLTVLGIRYAFISTMIAFAAGLWMIVLQGRFMGGAGNVIVLHGIGFHALQALPLLGWLLERADADNKRAPLLIHLGSRAWMLSIVLITIQTILGRSVFELSLLPLLAGGSLLVWFLTALMAVRKVRNAAAGGSLFKLFKVRRLQR